MIFIGSTSKAMADREKRGMTEIWKFEYLENEELFRSSKKHFFRVFEGLSFGEKKKKNW